MFVIAVLSTSLAQNIMADAGFKCDKAVVTGEQIRSTLCINISYSAVNTVAPWDAAVLS